MATVAPQPERSRCLRPAPSSDPAGDAAGDDHRPAQAGPVHDRTQEESFDEFHESDGAAHCGEHARACRLRLQQQQHCDKPAALLNPAAAPGRQHELLRRRRPAPPHTSAASSASASASAPASVAPSASAKPLEPSAKTTITVDCEPPKTQAAPRADWEADVKAFEKAHPLITIKSIDTAPCVNPATFNANLKAGKVADVFYVYNTDAQDVINKGQARTSSSTRAGSRASPTSSRRSSRVFQKDGTADGDLYGLPSKNYTLGLINNRALFTKAGLDPNKPPTTWADVMRTPRRSARSATAPSATPTTAPATPVAGTSPPRCTRKAATITADGKTADFNNDKGKAVLDNLHQMRWVDNSMGTKQLLQYDDLNQMMASGKLGMHVGAPDQVQRDHDNFKADYTKLGMGPMPGGQSTLLGGDGYLFNTKDTPTRSRPACCGWSSRS